MGRYKVEYDREGCIGVAACAAVDPDNWEIVEDGKADLKGGKDNPETKMSEIEIDEDQLEIFKEAAESCPVNVIHIIDKQTGKRII